MAGTPLFLITDAGLAVASVAMPQGPYIHIATFQIGSGYGYDPQTSDTGLNGDRLYSGVPTTYSNIGNNTIDIVLEIPPDAGPFDFGEVAVFLDDGTMFAKAVFDTPQTKYSSLGTNVVSSYTFHCLLKLQQSTAVFQIDTLNGPPAVWEVYKWSDVYPPGISANPDIPLTLVRELNEYGDSSLLSNTSDSYWSLESTSYKQYTGKIGASFAVTNSTTSWIEFSINNFRTSDLTTATRRFVIKTADGFFRSVSQVVASGSTAYRFYLNADPLLNAPPVNSICYIYRDDQAGGSIYYSQIVDPPFIPPQYVLPAATSTTLGGVTIGSGINQNGGGNISVTPYTLPIANGGQLGGVKIGSGLSESGDGTISAQQYSLPIANAGQLGGVKIGSGINEAGDGTISVPGRTPTGGGIAVNTTFGGGTYTYNATQNGVFHSWVIDDNSRNTNLYLNGINISQNTKNGGNGYGRRHHDICAFRTGDQVQYQTSGGSATIVVLVFDE